MKSSVKDKIKAVVFGAVCGVGILQTVLAFLWAWHNITTVQPFPETTLYLSMAEKMYSDGFHLIGYPLFINLCKWIGSFTKLPYVSVLYVLQLLFVHGFMDSGIAALLRAAANRKVHGRRVAFVTTLVVTNPFMFQLIFAILPDALSLALAVYILGNMFLWLRKAQEKNGVFAVSSMIALFILALLHRKIFWITLTGVCLIVIIGWIAGLKEISGEKRKFAPARLLIPACGICICLLGAYLINGQIKKATYDTNYMDYSLRADAMKRFVYPNLYDAYPNYTEEFKEQMPDYIVEMLSTDDPEMLYNSLGPMMEYRWGSAKTRRLCSMLNIKTALSHKQVLFRTTAKEWFSGIFSPIILAKNPYPFGDSVNPLYLNYMWQKNPKFTVFYCTAGRLGFGLCVVLLLAGGLLCIPGEPKKTVIGQIQNSLIFVMFIFQTSLSALLLSVPGFDFRNAILPCILWAVWGMSLLIKDQDEVLFFVGKEAKWEKQH